MKLSTLSDKGLIDLKMRLLMKFRLTDSTVEKIKIQSMMDRIDRVRLRRALEEEKI